MKLIIKNFSRIKESTIEIDGITVIAGHNNTGKSTIGKILFSLFNSLNNMDEKIERQRRREISTICNLHIRNYFAHSQDADINITRRLSSKLGQNLSSSIINSIDNTLEVDKIYAIITDYFNKNNILIEENSIMDISNKIVSIMELPNSLVMCEIISRYFENVFFGQVNCLNKKELDATLELVIKDKKIITSFKNNRCINCEANYSILHEAFYIDDPFIIDKVSQEFNDELSVIRSHILNKISIKESSILDGLFEAVIAKEKLEDIFTVLNKVIDGKLIMDGDEIRLDLENFNEPIIVNNLSTGLKSFLIIKILLEKAILKEKDVLILDEPEIHLHPEWQLVYAEIIVLLQKTFDLSILVTTHSSEFLEAIEYFSKKHLINNKCKYYLASSDNGLSIFKDVTGNLNEIYNQMIQPSILLDRLKYEMEMDDDE